MFEDDMRGSHLSPPLEEPIDLDNSIEELKLLEDPAFLEACGAATLLCADAFLESCGAAILLLCAAAILPLAAVAILLLPSCCCVLLPSCCVMLCSFSRTAVIMLLPPCLSLPNRFFSRSP